MIGLEPNVLEDIRYWFGLNLKKKIMHAPTEQWCIFIWNTHTYTYISNIKRNITIFVGGDEYIYSSLNKHETPLL